MQQLVQLAHELRLIKKVAQSELEDVVAKGGQIDGDDHRGHVHHKPCSVPVDLPQGELVLVQPAGDVRNLGTVGQIGQKVVDFAFQPQLQLVPAENIGQKQQGIKDEFNTKIQQLG